MFGFPIKLRISLRSDSLRKEIRFNVEYFLVGDRKY
jgi:hypothetical protein